MFSKSIESENCLKTIGVRFKNLRSESIQLTSFNFDHSWIRGGPGIQIFLQLRKTYTGDLAPRKGKRRRLASNIATNFFKVSSAVHIVNTFKGRPVGRREKGKQCNHSDNPEKEVNFSSSKSKKEKSARSVKKAHRSLSFIYILFSSS